MIMTNFNNISGYSHYIVFKGYKTYFVLAEPKKIIRILNNDLFYYNKKLDMYYNEKCKIFKFDGNLQYLLNYLPYKFKGVI